MHRPSRPEKALRATRRVRVGRKKMGRGARHRFPRVPPRSLSGRRAWRPSGVWGSASGCEPSASRVLGSSLELPLPPPPTPSCALQACGPQRPSLTSARSRGSRGPTGDRKRKGLHCSFSAESRERGRGRRRKGGGGELQFAARPPPETFQKELSFFKLATNCGLTPCSTG